MDDRALVEKLLARDERAFAEFFDTYAPRLFRFTMRRAGDEDLAEEITQTTLIAAVGKLKSWRGEASLFTWLCTISRRQLVDHWRKTARQPELRPFDDDPDVRAALESLASGGEAPRRGARRAAASLIACRSRSTICPIATATCSSGSTCRVSA